LKNPETLKKPKPNHEKTTAMKPTKITIAGVCLAALGQLPASADTINVPYHSEQLYAAYNSVNNNLNQIGTFGLPSGSENKLTAIAGPGYIGGDYWADYRTTWQFKLDELGINAADVASATLNWSRGQILWPSSNLAIDVVDSNFSSWNPILMYGGTQIASGLTTFADPGVSTGQLDITNVFKTALGNATPNSGLALQFYFVGPTGGTSPYQGGVLNTMSIVVTTNYASWATANAGGQAANLDWDNDGVPNGVEYFMNAAPGFTSNPTLDATNKVTWINGGKIPSAAYGSQFVVQTSSDLVTWEDVTDGDMDQNGTNTASSLSYTLDPANNPGKQFVRLKVTPN
jgi:hypothetical protein